VLIAPNLIGWLGLQQAAIDWALADFNGKVQVRQLSSVGSSRFLLAAFQSLTAPANRSPKLNHSAPTQRLGGFLFNRNLGHFEIVRPNRSAAASCAGGKQPRRRTGDIHEPAAIERTDYSSAGDALDCRRSV
jgi:hypothetical protein